MITLTPQDQDVPDKQAADRAVQLNITGGRPTIHFEDRRAGSGRRQSSAAHAEGRRPSVAVVWRSSDVTKNYNAGFDITKVREFADLVAEIAACSVSKRPASRALRGDLPSFTRLSKTPTADKGRMRRAVDAVMGYLKLAGGTALRNAAITAGNQAGSELDLAIRHIHL